jgi:hypothetical protein
MKIQLTQPLKNSPFIDNGLNTFKDIDCLYLDNINANLVRAHYHYFRSYFLKASMKFVANNPKQDAVETAQESKIEANQIALIMFDGNQEIIDRANQLLIKVCYKDENLKNRLTEIDLEQLDNDDWEALISNFLHAFWLNRWLTGTKTN